MHNQAYFDMRAKDPKTSDEATVFLMELDVSQVSKCKAGDLVKVKMFIDDSTTSSLRTIGTFIETVPTDKKDSK